MGSRQSLQEEKAGDGHFFSAVGKYNIFLICALLSLGLQNANILFFPGCVRPDEVFQYLEPAHALLDGNWVKTWEWRAQIRSWLVPDLIGGVMQASVFLGLSTPAHAVHFVFSLFFLPVIFLFILLGQQLGGRRWAWVFGLLAVFWPDYVMLACRTMGDSLGAVFFLAGVLLGMLVWLRLEGARLPFCPLVWFLAGLSFGIAGAVRFQLLPEIAFCLLFLTCLRWDWRGILCVLGGFLMPLFVLGAVDWHDFGFPYASIWRNFYVNEICHKADFFGTQPALFYVTKSFVRYPLTSFLILASFGAAFYRREGGMLCFPIAAFCSVILFHSFISHKEYSFILPAVFLLPLIVLLSCFVLTRHFLFWREKIFHYLVSFLVILCFCRLVEAWKPYHPVIENQMMGMQKKAFQRPDFCGLMILASEDIWWSQAAGYSQMPPQTGLYFAYGTKGLTPLVPKFNYLIAPPDIETVARRQRVKTVFKKEACTQNRICLYHRDSDGCASPPDYSQFSEMLKAHGE